MSKITKANEIKVPETVNGMIYGQPGVGKTTIALSMPKPLLIDTDGGIHRVQAEYRCDTVQVESYQDILDVLNEDLSEYESIVIDSWGKFVKYALMYFAEKDPKLVTKGGTYNIKIWGLIKSEMDRIDFEMARMGKNLLRVAHQDEKTDGDNTFIRIKGQGSSKDDILENLDFLGYVEMMGKRRSICFSPCSKYYAKNSILLDDEIQIPVLESNTPNTFMVDYIIKPSIERRKQEQEQKTLIDKQIADGRKLITTSKDPNATLEQLKAMDLQSYAKGVLFNELKASTSKEWNGKEFE